MPLAQGTIGLPDIYNGNDKIGKIYRGTDLCYQSLIEKSFFVKFVEDNLDDGWIKAEYFEDATSIREYAFYNKLSITRIDLPSTITNIGQYGIANCYNLTELNLNEGLIGIGDNALASLTSLTTLTIPSTVTSVGYTFASGCTSLTTLKMLPITPPSVTNLFTNGTYDVLSRIEVPASSLNAYQTADKWSSFASLMVGV